MSANAPTIIVDDNDARITYSGLWSLAGTEWDYRHTAYSSKDRNASMTFSFSGTSISVIGSFHAGGTCAYTISIDGSQSTLFRSPNVTESRHQATMYSSDRLDDGPHVFELGLDSCTGQEDTPYTSLDYVLYTPSADSSLDGVTYFIDDTNPSLSYSGGWTPREGDNNFNGTRTCGNKGASMRYSFIGTSLSVYGSISNTTEVAQGSFVVDDSDPVIFSALPQPGAVYNRLFFQPSRLSAGEHTLIFTANSDECMWIDYLIVNPGPSNNSSAAETTTSSTDLSQTPVGTIAGAVAGAVGLALLLAVVAFFWRRRRRRQLPLRTTSRSGLTAERSPGTHNHSLYPPRPAPPSSSTTSHENSSITSLSSSAVYDPFAVSKKFGERSFLSFYYDHGSSISHKPSENSIAASSTDTHRDNYSHTPGGTRTSRPLPAPPARTHSRTYTAPSVSSSGRTSTTRLRSVTVSNTDEEVEPDPDSITELKKRQNNAVVLTHENRSTLSQSYSARPVTIVPAYTDSGARLVDAEATSHWRDDIPLESPPQYTPRL